MANNRDFYDDLQALRQQTLANRREMQIKQAEQIVEEIKQHNEYARDCLRQNDQQGAEANMEQVMSLEADLQSHYLQLGPRDENQLSEAKQRWIARRQDLAANPLIVRNICLKQRNRLQSKQSHRAIRNIASSMAPGLMGRLPALKKTP
jgi:hypothetical protein